ncbi:MAG: glycosyltransferase family 2 protein [Chloroflexota bacterium]
MNKPLVSIVVVTLNRREELTEAVESLRWQTYSNTEIIVVDNGSSDGTQQMVKESFPDVRLVELDRNTGAYHGRNVGVDASRGKLVFFLDDDATLEKEAIAEIVGRFSREDRLGVIVCKLVSAGSHVLDMGPHFSAESAENEFYLGDMALEGATAIRRDVFESVGGWPAHYFRQYVGKDLSYRIIDAGYHILYFPRATAFHKESALGNMSRSQIEKQKMFYKIRNQLWISWKYLPPARAALESVVKITYHFGEALKMRAVGPYLKGLGAAAISMPRIILKERRPVSSSTVAQIDYMAYGGVITQAEMLASLRPIPFRTLLWRKLVTLLSRERNRSLSEKPR